MSAFFDSISPNSEGSNRIAALADYAVIAAAGEDALTFLQGQLTQDVTGLTQDAARLSGYCTAKGRLLATMVMWLAPPSAADAQPAEARLYALVRRDLAEALVKRLSMFVLRAKVKFTLTPLHVAGVWTESGDSTGLDAAVGGALPEAAWQRVELPTGTWIAAPTVSGRRWWWIANDAQLENAAGLAAQVSLDEAEAWACADLAAGLPWVCAATQDLFIPQTLNLDLIDGVSFTKGCYPGQEVVARSHYRGTVKRRSAYGKLESISQAPAPGVDIFEAGHPDDPRGRIVNATRDGALFEITLAALEGSDLRVGSADGAKLNIAPLPYNLADGGHKR